jgi:hypothetical protein
VDDEGPPPILFLEWVTSTERYRVTSREQRVATQNQLWQSSAGYVTTDFGALGTLAKLLNTVRGGVSAGKPS